MSSQGPIPHIPSQVLTLFLEGASSILSWPEGLSRNTAALLHQPNDLLAPTHPPGLANLSLMYGSVPACWAGSSECITFFFVRCNPTAKLQTSCWCRSHLSFPRGWHVSASGTALFSLPSSVLRAEQMLREYLSSERMSSELKNEKTNQEWWHTQVISSSRNLRREDSHSRPAWTPQKVLCQPELHSESLCQEHPLKVL